MKTTHYFILGSLLFLSTSLSAQDKKSSKTTQPTPTADQMKQQEKEQAAWMQYMTPGKVHAMLAKCDGDWHEDLVFWMDPKAPPTEAKAECTNTMTIQHVRPRTYSLAHLRQTGMCPRDPLQVP